ncbi:RidA family protein [Arenicella sp. 4NH20-0111]|uniref:RidA family protein n=1 Tax=Arenicella sp. 4NH20-0111 TaxID=3127648 RepID=UPI003103C671
MKKIIKTDQAPLAIGAYSQAVQVGDTVYISGQIPLDPQSMNVVSDEFEEQAKQVFRNLAAVSQAAGSTLKSAVKMTIYMTDLEDFATVNKVMEEYVGQPYPARAAVQVSALPKGVLLEVDAILQID